MCTLLQAYWDVATKRLVDNVPTAGVAPTRDDARERERERASFSFPWLRLSETRALVSSEEARNTQRRDARARLRFPRPVARLARRSFFSLRETKRKKKRFLRQVCMTMEHDFMAKVLKELESAVFLFAAELSSPNKAPELARLFRSHALGVRFVSSRRETGGEKDTRVTFSPRDVSRTCVCRKQVRTRRSSSCDGWRRRSACGWRRPWPPSATPRPRSRPPNPWSWTRSRPISVSTTRLETWAVGVCARVSVPPLKPVRDVQPGS